MNKIQTVAVISLGIASAINMNKDSYYKPVEFAQKKVFTSLMVITDGRLVSIIASSHGSSV